MGEVPIDLLQQGLSPEASPGMLQTTGQYFRQDFFQRPLLMECRAGPAHFQRSPLIGGHAQRWDAPLRRQLRNWCPG